MKVKQKTYYDQKRRAQVSDLEVGDFVLVRQEKENKLSTNFQTTPHRVIQKEGNSVQLEDVEGVQRRRNVVYVKKVLYNSEADKQKHWDDNVQSELFETVSQSDPVPSGGQDVPSVPQGNQDVPSSVIQGNQDVSSSVSQSVAEVEPRPRRARCVPLYLRDYVPK